MLLRGAVSPTCLQFLRRSEFLWTSELVQPIAARYRIGFDSRRGRENLASAVAMAMLRHIRKGAAHEEERNTRTSQRRWRLGFALLRRVVDI